MKQNEPNEARARERERERERAGRTNGSCAGSSLSVRQSFRPTDCCCALFLAFCKKRCTGVDHGVAVTRKGRHGQPNAAVRSTLDSGKWDWATFYTQQGERLH